MIPSHPEPAPNSPEAGSDAYGLRLDTLTKIADDLAAIRALLERTEATARKSAPAVLLMVQRAMMHKRVQRIIGGD